MTTFHKYPEIPRLERRPEILSVKQAVAVEKLHGTNFRVLFPAGMTAVEHLFLGGRNEELNAGSASFYGGRPIAWWTSRPDLVLGLLNAFRRRGIDGDITVYGEACGTGIQKGVRYGAPGEVLFRAFDIRIEENFVSYDLFTELCDEAGLPRVPEMWRGEPTLEAFDALLEKTSAEAVRNGIDDATNLSEGVVIRSNPLLRNAFGEWLIIKHKSDGFSEVAKRVPGAGGKNLAPAAAFVETYVVRGRVVNAIGGLRDAGTPLKSDMADMQFLVPAIVADLHKEQEAEWQEVLAQGILEKELRSAVTRALSRVFSQMLRERFVA